mgnify:CR=1 FL=1
MSMEQEKMEEWYDVIVVGGGPAGLTAAIYLARAKYRVLVIEKETFGGQITITAEVVNYPGVEKTAGTRLTETMKKQAEYFGAEFLLEEVRELVLEGDKKKVRTSNGERTCMGILIATGAHPRKIGFPGEDKFRGRGVAYCATCDGEFFSGMDVFVIGGGFAAAEESVFLTKYAKHVTILVREEDFTCAKTTADAARNHPDITVLTDTVVDEVKGEEQLSTITYHNTKTGESTTYHAPERQTFGVFVFAGYEPATELVSGLVELDEQGYVVTDQSQKTSVDGVYAAGDVCVKHLRQVVTAVGDGATAATELERYVQEIQKRTGWKTQQRVTRIDRSQKSQSSGSSFGETKNSIFSEEMLTQLHTVFNKMEQPLCLHLSLDDRPISMELKEYMKSLSAMTDKLTVKEEKLRENENLPVVRICKKDGTYTGLAFHGVPGGHEFTSFILGLYNASGDGQMLEKEEEERIGQLSGEIHLQILVSLSCTMCPELVVAAQKIASRKENVTAEVYDIHHFPELRERYQIMSVPCMVMNEEKITFGKKNISQVLDWLQN